MRPTASEAAALERIGTFLGGVYRHTLVSRIRLGRVAGDEQAEWRTTQKRHLTALSSSRWAGALTRTALDSYHLGLRGMRAEVVSLRAAVETIGVRMDAPVGGRTIPDTAGRRSGAKPVRGYATEAERFAESRRKAHLDDRLAAVSARCEARGPASSPEVDACGALGTISTGPQ